ncbi:hypothetical protein BH23ACT5_BH23ACT5_18900 [soil metagenome]
MRVEHHEGWSPQPIIGYRLWGIANDEIRGAIGHPWPAPHMDATCSRARPQDDLPHTDFTSSEVGYGCGIYAASSAGGLVPPRASGWVVGMVLLSGKVVEHDRGYRASHARVAAAIAHLDGRQLATADIDLLDDLFATPSPTVATKGEPFPSWDHATHIAILEDLERSMEPWTLGASG